MTKSIYTFWELINQWPIVIPQVQRDYAYGRTDAKAVAVSTGILRSIHKALADETSTPLALDFVYGSVREGIGMTPLDGQQRLTTLFLLHLYASIMEGKTEERQPLKRFIYQTRQSANTFCENLVSWFEYHTDFKKERLSKQIQASPRYIPSYDGDPTIASMLVVLDRIADMFGDIEGLWEKLTEQRRVFFYFLPLNQFGLSDDLFIKMNSRGKPLTEYELFKSDFEEFLEKNYPVKKESFSQKLDTIWTDMLWKISNNDVSNVDNGFIYFFHNVSLLLYHLKNDSNFGEYGRKEDLYLSLPFDNQFTCEEDVYLLEDILTTIHAISTSEGFQSHWERNFCMTDRTTVPIENEDKIRLFWPQKEPLFVLVFRRKLSVAQLVLFYAIYLGFAEGLMEEELMIRLRHLRNLVENSEFEFRATRIHGMFLQTEKYMKEGILPDNFFNANQLSEEAQKAAMPLQQWQSLWKYENHFILRGSLLLFINTSRLDLLPKFHSLFDDNYVENTNLLRLALLAVGGEKDYMQYEAYMETDTFQRRYFVNRWDAWPRFFVWNNRRRNQEAIIECLDRMPNAVKDIPQLLETSLEHISTKGWKYYMIKYPEDRQTNVPWSQGIYHWDDMQGRPLEAIMLNSSQHGVYNLEWNILNSTLRTLDWERFWGDDHNHEVVRLTRANSALDADQTGWIVSTYEPEYLLDELHSLFRNGSSKYQWDGNTVIVPEGIDYIEIGLELATDIEAIYSEHHKNDDSERTPVIEQSAD